jgi:glycolate oxidase iron-sulfur subunit
MTLQKVSALNALQLLSSNIGCRQHLSAGIARQGLNLPTQHPLTLPAQQLAHDD